VSAPTGRFVSTEVEIEAARVADARVRDASERKTRLDLLNGLLDEARDGGIDGSRIHTVHGDVWVHTTDDVIRWLLRMVNRD